MIEDEPTWRRWADAANRDSMTTCERRAVAAARSVSEDAFADWGWCVRCRELWTPGHACFYPLPAPTPPARRPTWESFACWTPPYASPAWQRWHTALLLQPALVAAITSGAYCWLADAR